MDPGRTLSGVAASRPGDLSDLVNLSDLGDLRAKSATT